MGYIRTHEGTPLYENISDVPWDYIISGKRFGVIERNVPIELTGNRFKKAVFIDVEGHSPTLIGIALWIGLVAVIGIVTFAILDQVYLIMTASAYEFDYHDEDTGVRTYKNKTGDLITIDTEGNIIDESHVGGLAWLNQIVVLAIAIIIGILLFYYFRSIG